MPIVKSSTAPTFHLPGLDVVGLASPSRGACETCVWRIALPPGTPGTSHIVDREEIFVALSGEARLELGGTETVFASGDALVIPVGEPFSLSNTGTEPFTALALQPVGGKAVPPGGEPFSPSWTL